MGDKDKSGRKTAARPESPRITPREIPAQAKRDAAPISGEVTVDEAAAWPDLKPTDAKNTRSAAAKKVRQANLNVEEAESGELEFLYGERE